MVHISTFVFALCVVQEPNIIYGSRWSTTWISPPSTSNPTHIDNLRQDLLLNYDKFARPAQHYNVTRVNFGLEIKHIELNEFKSTLLVHTWLRLLWTDEKLKWTSSKYGDITLVHLADHEIWQPDIFLFNSATNLPITHYSNVYCIVYDNGEVLWLPTAQLSALCDLNLKYWPFDTQRCEMVFASWTYAGDQVDFDLMNNKTEAELDLLVTNSEWKIIKTSVTKNNKYYSCCPESYPEIIVELILSRTSSAYKALIISPAFVVIILILLSFWLPSQTGEKIVLNAFTVLFVCLFMLYFAQKIPAMGTHTPLIVLFYSSCLYVASFSIITSVIVIYLSRSKHNSPLPWIIKKPLTGKLGKLLGLNSYIQQPSMIPHRVTVEEMRDHQVIDFEVYNSEDEHHIIQTSKKNFIQQDWLFLAVAIDRLAFCFFCLLFIIITIAYLV